MIVFVCLLFAFVLAAGWWMYRWQYDAAERILREWASQQQLTLVEQVVENDPYSGPENRYASNKQIKYRITVRDAQGRLRHGIATVGGKAMGALDQRIDVLLNP